MNKKLLIGLLLAALVGGLVFAYVQNRSSSSILESPTQEELDRMNSEDETLNSEKNSSEQQSEPANQSETSNKKSVVVNISQAEVSGSLVEVRAYANVLEDGTCTAVFTNGSETKTYTENTELQPSYTQCNPFQIPKSDFSSGTWRLTLTFESASHKGQASQDVNI